MSRIIQTTCALFVFSAVILVVLMSPALQGQVSYSYDRSGNIVSVGSDTYLYDRFGRVVSGTAGSAHSQTYTYDRFGNILTITTTSPLTGGVPSMRRLGVNANNNRIDSQPPADNPPSTAVYGTYDPAGRMTALNGTANFSYDALDSVRESTVLGDRRIHIYSASDERIASIDPASGTEQFTLRDAGARILRRVNRDAAGSWQWTEDYVYRGDDQLSALVSSPEKERHFHVDHIGSPRLITGAGGALLEEHHYYAYGEESTTPGADDDQKKFTGHERDNREIDYMHARYYGSRMGRFLSVDPGRDWDSENPQSWNLYSYTRGNPVLSVDPTGRDAVSEATRAACEGGDRNCPAPVIAELEIGHKEEVNLSGAVVAKYEHRITIDAANLEVRGSAGPTLAVGKQSVIEAAPEVQLISWNDGVLPAMPDGKLDTPVSKTKATTKGTQHQAALSLTVEGFGITISASEISLKIPLSPAVSAKVGVNAASALGRSQRFFGYANSTVKNGYLRMAGVPTPFAIRH